MPKFVLIAQAVLTTSLWVTGSRSEYRPKLDVDKKPVFVQLTLDHCIQAALSKANLRRAGSNERDDRRQAR